VQPLVPLFLKIWDCELDMISHVCRTMTLRSKGYFQHILEGYIEGSLTLVPSHFLLLLSPCMSTFLDIREKCFIINPPPLN
jgi:hypothetical protein